jgi:hypothetical protein
MLMAQMLMIMPPPCPRETPCHEKAPGLFRRIGSALILVWMLGFLWFAWFLPQRAPMAPPPTASSC